jgi:hypothetical protein
METATTARERLTDTQKQLADVEQQLADARAARDVAVIGQLTAVRDTLRGFATEDDVAERTAREAALRDEARALVDAMKRSFAQHAQDAGIARERALGSLRDAKVAIGDALTAYFRACWLQRSIELVGLRFSDIHDSVPNPTPPLFSQALEEVEKRTGPMPVVPRPLISVTASTTDDERHRIEFAALDTFLTAVTLPDTDAQDFFARAGARPLTER